MRTVERREVVEVREVELARDHRSRDHTAEDADERREVVEEEHEERVEVAHRHLLEVRHVRLDAQARLAPCEVARRHCF